MFIKISNNGTCPPEAFTLLGVSTARGKSDKVGQFGSGCKHSVGLCIRKNLHLEIYSGTDLKVTFGAEKRFIGETPYKQIICYINGTPKELGFAAEFGEIDWTCETMAIREFVSNAIDPLS